MAIIDANDSTSSLASAVSSTLPFVDNNDPVGNLQNSQRVAQQHILPTAIQPRFLNPVQQTPVPLNIASVTLNDLGLVNQTISDGIIAPNTVALFVFEFINTLTTTLSVDLSASLFIDGTNIVNAYPFGGQVAPTNWSVERSKGSHFFDTEADPQTYLPNQSNQSTEFITVKNLGASGDHVLYIYYYWRAISNQGGSKS